MYNVYVTFVQRQEATDIMEDTDVTYVSHNVYVMCMQRQEATDIMEDTKDKCDKDFGGKSNPYTLKPQPSARNPQP